MFKLLRKSLIVVLPFVLMACGESGSEPDQFSEGRFDVQQDGGGTFTLLSLSAGGFQRRISKSAVYTTQGTVHFLVEGSPLPYSAEICRRSGGDMTLLFTADSTSLPGQVQLIFTTQGSSGHCRSSFDLCNGAPVGDSCLSDSDCPGAVCEKRITMEYPPNSNALASTAFPDPDVRFEVCEPSGTTPCTVSGSPASTIYGKIISGSVGDIASTYLVNSEIPTVYFLHSAKDNVTAVLRAAAEEYLQVQLFVNDTLKDTEAGTHDVVVREDL